MKIGQLVQAFTAHGCVCVCVCVCARACVCACVVCVCVCVQTAHYITIWILHSNKIGKVWKRNIEARSCNHCCSGKAVIITQPECVFVTLGTQHATRMRHIVTRGLPCSTIFFHIITLMARSSKKKTESKMRVSIFSTTFVWNIFHSKKNGARYDQKYILVFT